MMDCKAALQECDGDMVAAVDWLRTKLSGQRLKGRSPQLFGLVGVAPAHGGRCGGSQFRNRLCSAQ